MPRVFMGSTTTSTRPPSLRFGAPLRGLAATKSERLIREANRESGFRKSLSSPIRRQGPERRIGFAVLSQVELLHTNCEKYRVPSLELRVIRHETDRVESNAAQELRSRSRPLLIPTRLRVSVFF